MLVRDAMHAGVVTVSGHTTLPEAVVLMHTLSIRRLPVVQDNQVVGIVTDSQIRRHLPALREALSPWDFAYRAGRVQVSEITRRPALTTAPDLPLARAVQTMLDRHVGGLPVVDEDAGLVGMLTCTDVLRAATRAARLEWGTVRQHMTQDAVSADVEDTLDAAVERFLRTSLRVLPVLEGGELVGVLHAQDLAHACDLTRAAHQGPIPDDQVVLPGRVVRDLMRLPSIHVSDHLPLRDAMERMLEADVHGLPVITDDGELLGVLTISDVLRAILGRHAGVPQTPPAVAARPG